ncbi:hypothetical protein [Clostridium pasteurianum]|nr:hypothetical protein [Clostridium pasteurianum]
MALNVVLPGSLNKTERQIRALEAVIPKDTAKDKAIHQEALKKLKEHRKFLLESEVC